MYRTEKMVREQRNSLYLLLEQDVLLDQFLAELESVLQQDPPAQHPGVLHR